MIHAFDAAYCPGVATLRTLRSENVELAGGYVGGAAEHTWTDLEWARVRDEGFRPLPLWVAPYGAATHELGALAGNAALTRMQEVGLTSLVVLDLEAGYNVDAEWLTGFEDALTIGSCDLALYATPGDLRRYDPSVSRLFSWAADPGASWFFLQADTAGWQYFFGAYYDLSVFDTGTPTASYS
jgi:hypothetical protein